MAPRTTPEPPKEQRGRPSLRPTFREALSHGEGNYQPRGLAPGPLLSQDPLRCPSHLHLGPERWRHTLHSAVPDGGRGDDFSTPPSSDYVVCGRRGWKYIPNHSSKAVLARSSGRHRLGKLRNVDVSGN
ncbi:hypothetical protein MAPG_09237 [Magnaporthiopsis poae ATCC 64411]|uniref:Uncharacterized protein n=1 Tax=Magnaporthiopsis poae (strain ATCC 64411 / 73-15) TaxID=644358 RepID=A0A0C4E9F3_MAGP6|nr:hypothetical protein MAPG_09237 [Magnaporthiopsis poae ATCC 64411]